MSNTRLLSLHNTSFHTEYQSCCDNASPGLQVTSWLSNGNAVDRVEQLIVYVACLAADFKSQIHFLLGPVLLLKKTPLPSY